jgi:hypothetical protein
LRSGHGLPHRNGLKIVVRDRVLVFFSEKPLLDQDVERWRKRAGVLALKECDRPRVLLAAEHEFSFPLAPGKCAPRRQRSGHRHCHHRHQDEERDHCIAALIPGHPRAI